MTLLSSAQARLLIQSIQEGIDGTFPSIKCTCEEEQDESLPFLDTMGMRNQNGRLSMAVYRKPTQMDRYLDFVSCHHKRAVVNTLLKRARNIKSTAEGKRSGTEHLKWVLKANGYPDHLYP